MNIAIVGATGNVGRKTLDILENVTVFSFLVRPLAQQDLPSRNIIWEGSTSASYYILNIARQRSALGSESFVSRPILESLGKPKSSENL